ncbi:hypothetical protein JTE90_017561 [Oedothorax gibbosus]|uniref:DNA repair protein XRCC4 n=1 Tax=Oedothorax gibbosus TaxID=931172 RepID=A0AAV6UMT2_9ARAC|nr:hypothetical protein JTE90_017561 [Oedothorax gibbosus]
MVLKKSLKNIHLQQDNHDVCLFSEHEAEGNLRFYILNVELKEAYFGQVNDFDLRVQAANIRLTYNDFIKKATDALFEKNTDSYLYTLDKQNGKFIFKWKSIDHEETVINLGHVEMHERDYLLMFTEVLAAVSDEMHLLNSKVATLSAKVNESETFASETVKQLQHSMEVKESMEKELYSKFVMVLNTKKRRIRELQEKLGSKNQPKHSKRAKTSHILSSDSSDVDGELDANEPGPSKVTGRDSLLFPDDDEPIVPMAKNRARNRKVPVTQKSDFVKKVEVEKSSWVTSPKSEEDNDSDDLLKCL